MEFDFANTLVNYGALGICLGYFIYKDNTTTKELTKTVSALKEVVNLLCEKVGK